MAVGDKYFAVMKNELAVSNGVATLGPDGLLNALQRPITDSMPTQGSSNPVQSGGVFSALSNKADKEQPQGYDLPLENGWDVYGICKYWLTQDGMCFVNIGAHATSPPSTEQVVLATLPEGFRPNANVYAPACVSFPRVPGDLQINPDGQIIYTWATLENETYISAFFGFLVNQ